MRVVLVVDDNATSLTILNGMLKDSYKVYPVNSGSSALRLLETRIPDLILLDVEMPEMNGFEVMEKISSDPRLAGIPVIFLSGLTEPELEAMAFNVGAVDYLPKPVDHLVLKARLKYHIDVAEKLKTTAAQT